MTQLKNLLSNLAHSETALSSASAAAEQQFLEVGKSLQEMNELSKELVLQTNALVGVSADGEQQPLPIGIQLVDGLLHFLGSGIDTARQLTAELERQKDRISHLRRMDKALQRTIAPLHFMRVLFKIESAGLAPEKQERFTALTGEIDRLNIQVREIFGTQFEALVGTEKSIAELVRHLKEHAARQEAIVKEKQAAIAHSLDGLRGQMSLYQTREEQLQEASRAIAGEVGRVVMALQGQDNVAQRIQHVRQAIDGIVHSAESDSSASELPPALSESIHVVSRIQSEQLQAIELLLPPAEEQIVSGIRRVDELIEALIQQCLKVEGGQVSGVVQDMVRVLLDTLADMHGAVRGAVAQAEQCHRQVRKLDCLATNLMTAVRQIATQMHWMGINAEIQALRVVGGNGLEVLSAQASQIASETTLLSETAAVELDGLAASLDRCIAAFEEMSSGGRRKEEELNRQGVNVRNLLEGFRESTVNRLGNVDQLLDGIRHKATAAVNTMDFENTMSPHLEALQKTFRELAGISKPPSEPEPQHLSQWLRPLEASYTMAQERELHSRVLSSLGLLVAEPAAPAAADGGCDIELF